MALVELLLLVVWTLLAVRIFAARATIGERTLLTYLVAGAILGPLALPFTQKLFAPYNETGPWIFLFISLLRQALLVAPALFIAARFRALSVADAFLLAFVFGFGFDLSAALLAATVAAEPVRGLALFPPAEISGPRGTVAGYAYWSALAALAFAASRRFLRTPKTVWLVSGTVFLWVAIEAATLLLPAGGIFGLVAALTFHGKLTAWLALIALAGLSAYEVQWAASAAPESGAGLLAEWQALIQSLLKLDFRRYRALREQFAVARELELARAEARVEPGDQTLGGLARGLELRLEKLKNIPERGSRRAPIVSTNPWRDPAVAAWAGWLALVVVALLPHFPAVGKFFWSFWLFHYKPGGFPLTLLETLLVVVILRRCVLAAGRPDRSGDADDAIQFRGEDVILKTALAIVLLLFVHTKPEMLYPFASMIVYFTNARMPSFTPVQLVTFLLLFATAASSLTAPRMIRWRRAPLAERRAAALRNALQIVLAFVVVWVLNAFYPALIVMFHWEIGWTSFNWFGASGNWVIALLTTLLMALAGFAVYRALAPLSRRIEKFLVG